MHLHARVHAAHVLLGEQQVVRSDLRAHPPAARLGARHRLHRGGAAQVLEVHARVLVTRQRGVAGDHRGLAERGNPGQAEGRADRALVHAAAPGERGVLLVQGDHAAAQALVLQRLAQHARALHGPAVVGEAEGARFAQLRHLGQLLALQASRDRRQLHCMDC